MHVRMLGEIDIMTEKYYINEERIKKEGRTREAIALLCIANELAEANRLKRLELINTLPDGVSEDTIYGIDKNE